MASHYLLALPQILKTISLILSLKLIKANGLIYKFYVISKFEG